MKNVLTVDLESVTHAHKIFKKFTGLERKKMDNGHILKSTDFLLRLFDEYKVTATFFVLGEVYEWYPDLIKKIYSQGHEVGYHTHEHIIVNNNDLLETEIKKSSKLFMDFKIVGFRAPFCRLKIECFEILKRYGFKYDSSIYSSVGIFEPIDEMTEVPISSFKYNKFTKGMGKCIFPRHLTVKMLLSELPFGSAYFLGLLQRKVCYFINKFNKDGRPAVLVLHPWQISRPCDIPFLNKKFLITNPQWLPDVFSIKQSLIDLCKKFNFLSIGNFLKLG